MANIIVPISREMQVAPYTRVRRVSVKLDAQDAHKLGDDKFMLSKPQLMSLAGVAGLQMVTSVQLPSDHPNIVNWQVTMKDRDGRTFIGTYSLDMRTQERDGVDGSVITKLILDKEARAEQYKKLPPNRRWKNMPKSDDQAEWDAWVRSEALKEWAAINRHRIARSETGAMLRAVRSALNIKTTYTKRELDDEFVYYEEVTDWNALMKDKQAARAIMSATIARTLGVSQDEVLALMEPQQESSAMIISYATRDQVEALIEDMLEAGFKNRDQCVDRIMDVFGVEPDYLTVDHLHIIRESLEIAKTADKDTINKLPDLMRRAYEENTTIAELINEGPDAENDGN